MDKPDLNDVLKAHEFDLWDHSILLGYVGSISHGKEEENVVGIE